MYLSFVILTRNSEKYISRCLDSIEASLPGSAEREIFVVDNGSTDRTCAILDSRNNITAIKLGRNYGTTYSRNLALRKAAGDHLVVMDSDVIINRLDWPAILSELGPKIGLIAPRLNLPSGERQNSVKRFPTLQWRLRKIKKIIFGLTVEDKELYPSLERIEFPDTAISAFWVIPKEVLGSVGFLDEKIFYSPEDVDYCVRVWKKGFIIKYYQDADIVHYTQQIAHKKPFSLISLSFFLNFIYYFWKHGYWFDSAEINKIKEAVLHS